MSARRCPDCLISWWDLEEFNECPKCEEPTDFVNNIKPDMELDEARSQAAHFRFEKFYAARTPNLSFTPEELEKFTLAGWKKEVRLVRQAEAEEEARKERNRRVVR